MFVAGESGIKKELFIPSVSIRASIHWHGMTRLDDSVYTESSANSEEPLQAIPAAVLGALLRLLREVRFGSIEIVVHEGRITQIERREKVRFGSSGSTRRE